MTRDELLEKICPSDNITDCCTEECLFGCDDCKITLEYMLDEYEQTIREDAIDEYKHLLKETFNDALPTNYHCTKPFFTLDNVRLLTDAVARELKEQKND